MPKYKAQVTYDVMDDDSKLVFCQDATYEQASAMLHVKLEAFLTDSLTANYKFASTNDLNLEIEAYIKDNVRFDLNLTKDGMTVTAMDKLTETLFEVVPMAYA